MKELKVTETYTQEGLKPSPIQAYIPEWSDAEIESEERITKEEFHSILDKASQPTEKPESDSEQS